MSHAERENPQHIISDRKRWSSDSAAEGLPIVETERTIDPLAAFLLAQEEAATKRSALLAELATLDARRDAIHAALGTVAPVEAAPKPRARAKPQDRRRPLLAVIRDNVAEPCDAIAHRLGWSEDITRAALASAVRAKVVLRTGDLYSIATSHAPGAS